MGVLFTTTLIITASVQRASYIQHMQKDQTWGDELTLRAASDVYKVKINVITSDVRWRSTVGHSTVGRFTGGRRLIFLY